MCLKEKKLARLWVKYSKRMYRPIAISLSPNLENIDVVLALRLLFAPWKWFSGEHITLLEQWFRHYFTVSYAISFSSGRGALYAVLKAMGIKENDEVLLQAFTCVAVPNAVLALQAKPIYSDIDETLTINVSDLESKISKKTKAIIVQHTFGIPTNMKKIHFLAKKYQLLVIEDCAHTISGLYEGKKLGTLSDAAIFSFGRDKAFSSVFGGMAITKNGELGKKIRQFQKQREYPNMFWIFQQIFHPVAFFFILPIYNVFSLGKVLLIVLQRLNLLSFPVLPEEKEGKSVSVFLRKFPNALAALSLLQLKRLNTFNKKRRDMSMVYREILGEQIVFPEETSLLRFPVLVEKREEVMQLLRKQGIYIGKWYAEVIDPNGTQFKKVGYTIGSCVYAEYVAKRIVNLPTYPAMSKEDAKKIGLLVKKYVGN